jgi:hypothetical protein
MRKKVQILVLASLTIMPSPALADQFCDGFKRGYITGYKQASGSSFEPFAPFCPFQPFKRFNDPSSDFEHGYIIGLQKGLEDGRSRR